jgi:HAD superfamily hydrolase (TIGR01484 family)
MQKYKALMLDLDGTTVPIGFDSVPSEKVKKAIADANKKVLVGIATSRPYHIVEYLLDQLVLSAPCIINGGSEIIDPATKETLFRQAVSEDAIKQVFLVVKEMHLTMHVDFHDRSAEMTDSINLQGVLSAYTFQEPESVVDEFLTRLSAIPDISTHKMPSPEKGKLYVSINHVSSSKQFGILKVAERLGIQTSEMIAVGDGQNDMPLLMACGFRIAMGNAGEELKAIADYIAPSVEEDGVADVIEKYILNE